MSMPLSFTSAVSPVAAIPTPRAATETATASQPAAAPANPAPVATPSQNTLNAQNLLNTLVGDISAAAPTAVAPGVTRGQ